MLAGTLIGGFVGGAVVLLIPVRAQRALVTVAAVGLTAWYFVA